MFCERELRRFLILDDVMKGIQGRDSQRPRGERWISRKKVPAPVQTQETAGGYGGNEATDAPRIPYGTPSSLGSSDGSATLSFPQNFNSRVLPRNVDNPRIGNVKHGERTGHEAPFTDESIGDINMRRKVLRRGHLQQQRHCSHSSRPWPPTHTSA